jgi:hypothetical protein
MCLLSIDVGIRNLAYCMFDSSGDIVDWNILNLMGAEPAAKTCQEIQQNKAVCGKKATFEVGATCGFLNATRSYAPTSSAPLQPPSLTGNLRSRGVAGETAPSLLTGNHEAGGSQGGLAPEAHMTAQAVKQSPCYCNKHAKTSGFIMPTPQLAPSNLKKQKINQLKQMAASLHIPIPREDTRQTILTKILAFLADNGLTQIKFQKANAGHADLIGIGRELKRQMDNKPHFRDITKVIIENQISPIATRMKTIQGMIAQYFIMRNDAIVIEFVSSSGKLKGFEKQNTEVASEYSQHKKDAVFYCKQFLNTEKYEKWKFMMEMKKKDDLADCFLQGVQGDCRPPCDPPAAPLP